MKQVITLFGAIIIGSLFPILEVFTPLIAPLLMVMMFFSFLGAEISWKFFLEKRVWILFFANITIGVLAYFTVLPLGETVAFIAFIVGMTPTALAAPALLSFLGKRTDFAIASVFVTNFGIILILPFLVQYMVQVDIEVGEMMIKTLILLVVPLLLELGIKNFFPTIRKKILGYRAWVFYVWATIIVIAMARSSQFLRDNWDEYGEFILPIFIVTGVLCAINFLVGYFIGGTTLNEEASQSLGQKNPMLMVWIALQFFTPVVALGPTFYIFFHHLVNGWKLMRYKKNP